MPAQAAATAPTLPAWRIELNEKVRAIRARRAGSQAEVAIEEIPDSYDISPAATLVAARPEDRRLPHPVESTVPATATRPELNPALDSPAIPARRTSSNIVEAALIRVKRASENASRAALPKIEPAKPIQASPQISLSVDREATARALEPIPAVEPKIELPPAPNLETAPSSITRPVNVEPHRQQAAVVEPATVIEAVIETVAPAPAGKATPVENLAVDDPVAPAAMSPIDELEPLDYLEAEVRKVDRTLGSQFLKNESPSLFTHAVIDIVDLLAVAASCSPFLATIRIADGSFSNPQTALAGGLIVALVAFFYLALTQCLCGKTFGMMLTNTRVVDIETFEPLSGPRALIRTAGYFIAAAPALLGFAWSAFNRKHRGWPDILSRGMVVRDF